MLRRADALDALLRAVDYRGWDPFDLTNSPLLPIPQRWWLPQVVVSKFGSRFAPEWLRRFLLVPKVEDPKTYACAYFGYVARGDAASAARAREMADRLARLGQHRDGVYWGYDFTWATFGVGVNRRGASTIVPASFAIIALAHDLARSTGARHGPLVRDGIEYLATQHHADGPQGEFLSYFKRGTVITHNANLLGCTALTIGGTLFGKRTWLQRAAQCTATTLTQIGPDGYLRYAEHPKYDWTDCFHHLYVMACLQVLARQNPDVDSREVQAGVERMRRYFREAFLRSDGRLNYHPGGLYPVDPHNYAAASIYAVLFGTEDDLPARKAADLLRMVDDDLWDAEERRYLFRRQARRLDRRLFVRWTQAWMFAALAIVAAGGIPGVPVATVSPLPAH